MADCIQTGTIGIGTADNFTELDIFVAIDVKLRIDCRIFYITIVANTTIKLTIFRMFFMGSGFWRQTMAAIA